jgi:hypothetical protein
MALSRTKKRFALFDIDNCLVDKTGVISQDLILLYQQQDFDGWIVVTHRCIAASRHLYNKYVDQKVGLFTNPFLLTTQIVESVSKLLGSDPLAVSTPDDCGIQFTTGVAFENQCGMGYELLHKPFENAIKNKNLKHHQDQFPYFGQDPDNENLDEFLCSKNPQIMQVAHFTSSRHLDSEVELFYFDDRNHLCQDIANIVLENWPKNVAANSYCYDVADPKNKKPDLNAPVAVVKACQLEEKYNQSSSSSTSAIMREITLKTGWRVVFDEEPNVVTVSYSVRTESTATSANETISKASAEEKAEFRASR